VGIISLEGNLKSGLEGETFKSGSKYLDRAVLGRQHGETEKINQGSSRRCEEWARWERDPTSTKPDNIMGTACFASDGIGSKTEVQTAKRDALRPSENASGKKDLLPAGSSTD